MPLNLDQLLPSLNQSLDGIGFLFGAGASVEAGYPMMNVLTRGVIGQLTTAERSSLDQLLTAAGITYDDGEAVPNIEDLSDLTISHAVNSGDLRYKALEERFRELIVSELLSVGAPVLDNHIKFFQRLKARSFGLPSTVWIFTTNYDILLETGAALAGVTLENGFSGAATRFFDPSRFGLTVGSVKNHRFNQAPGLTVKLIKLHGSLSWLNLEGRILEQHPSSVPAATARTMVLPRRRKVMDTLVHPYDQLFAQASRIIGVECRYLLSCGFSFADEHIKQTILIPPLRAGRCRLSCLCEKEPPGLTDLLEVPSVSAAFSTHSSLRGVDTSESSDLWMFSNLAEAL